MSPHCPTFWVLPQAQSANCGSQVWGLYPPSALDVAGIHPAPHLPTPNHVLPIFCSFSLSDQGLLSPENRKAVPASHTFPEAGTPGLLTAPTGCSGMDLVAS